MGKSDKGMRMVKDLVRLVRFLRRMDVDLHYFMLSVIVLVILAFFQTYAIQLLYSLIDGIVHADFLFVKEMPILGGFVRAHPQAFAGSTALFIFLVGWSYLITLLKCALHYSAQLTIAHQAQKASVSIRKLIFDRYLRFGKLFFDRNDVAGLSQLIMTSTDVISGQVLAFQQLLAQVLTLAVYIALMCHISWQLTLTVGAIFPLMNLVAFVLIKRLEQNSIAHHSSLMGLHKKMFNILTCIPLVKGYGKEEEERRLFADVSKREVSAAFARARTQHLVTPVQDICQTTALLLAAAALAVLGSRQHMDASHILIFFYLATRAVPMFNALTSFAMSMANLEGPISSIEAILSDDDKFIVPDGQRQFDTLRSGIEFKSLHFSYLPTLPVLRGVSFSMRRGEMVAIVGATGAGKTTLVNLLLRFYDCPASSLLIDGVDIGAFTAASLRDRMAFVSQEIFIFNDTIRANVTYAVNDEVPDERLLPILKKARLYDFVTSLPEGLDTVVGDHGVKLSGGEKQRIALARALLKNAEILILDEATSSLDTVTEHLIQEALEAAVRGRTTVVIAHRLSTVRRADRVVVLERGRVAEEGTVQELLACGGRFFELWQTQKLGAEVPVGA